MDLNCCISWLLDVGSIPGGDALTIVGTTTEDPGYHVDFVEGAAAGSEQF